MAITIVLLPGLEGTGELFEEFAAALPKSLKPITVAYPTDRFLSYGELRDMVSARLPIEEPFVLLGESYSAPLAVQIAAAKPKNLVALVLSSGFVFKPVGWWTGMADALGKPWVFRLNPPSLIAEYFAIGMDAPRPFVQRAIHVWRSVSPEVLSGRVRDAMEVDARADLAKTTMPLLDLRGTKDHLLADSCVVDMKRIRPDMKIARVAASHMILQRAPAEGAQIIAEFIKGVGI